MPATCRNHIRKNEKLTEKSNYTDATHFVKTWMKHQRDLEENSLQYLDSLMDALARVEPTVPHDMRQQLVSMVPFLPYGTARRLVNLKYHNPPENIRIQGA